MPLILNITKYCYIASSIKLQHKFVMQLCKCLSEIFGKGVQAHLDSVSYLQKKILKTRMTKSIKAKL